MSSTTIIVPPVPPPAQDRFSLASNSNDVNTGSIVEASKLPEIGTGEKLTGAICSLVVRNATPALPLSVVFVRCPAGFRTSVRDPANRRTAASRFRSVGAARSVLLRRA